MRRRLLVTAFVGALCVVASFSALAWACTPQAYIDVGGASGPGGTSVTVTGRGFVAAPVEITWSGGGVLATAHGPDFSVTVRIPEAAPGVYYLTATGRDAASGVVGRATRAFEVVAPPAPTVVEAPAVQEPVEEAAQLETSGATGPPSSATRGERGQRASARATRAAEAAAPVTATSRSSAVADPVARTGTGERAVTRARAAARERTAPATGATRTAPRYRPDVAATPATRVAPSAAGAVASERTPAADDGPGWPLVAALALLGWGVLALLSVTAPRAVNTLAAPRRETAPVADVVLPDDLVARLEAVLAEAADRSEDERPLNV